MKKIALIPILFFVLITSVFLLYITINYFLYGDARLTKKGGLACEDCNLIIISLTNTRKDHIGLYGYNLDTTPNIDEFFKDSLIFENAFSPTSWTLPAAASLFTSLFPQAHGIINRHEGKKIPANQQTLAEILKNNNYKTAAFTGGGDYNRVYGFNRGFDEYNDNKNFAGISDSINDITDWLNTNKEKKFFLFIQGFDTHCPFNPPYPYNEKYNDGNDSRLDASTCYWNLNKDALRTSDEEQKYIVYKQGRGINEPIQISLDEADRKRLIGLYDGAINYADEFLKDIFSSIEELKLKKKTIVVFLSEHGDLLGENGRFMRTDILGTFSDRVLNIPLLIKHPAVDEERRINGLVNLVDLAPTLLSFLDIEYDSSKIHGKNVLPLIERGKEMNKYAYAEMLYRGSKENPFFKNIYAVSMIRNLENKLIYERILNLENKTLIKEKYKFYVVKKDPLELNNLFKKTRFSDEIDELRNELLKWRETTDFLHDLDTIP